MKKYLLQLYNKLLQHIDKVAHFAITYGIVYTLVDKWNAIGALAVGILLGIIKEVWDKLRYGKFSIGDLIADVSGIGLSFIIGSVL